jgi:hypothetical protein
MINLMHVQTSIFEIISYSQEDTAMTKHIHRKKCVERKKIEKYE